MISNKDIKWQKFPASIEDVAGHFGNFQTIMVIKSSKAVTEDDPNGVLFGMLYAPSGTSEDLIFTGAKWCSYHDCYHEIEIVPKESVLLKGINEYSSISQKIKIEDIEEYYVVEFNHMLKESDESPIYSPLDQDK